MLAAVENFYGPSALPEHGGQTFTCFIDSKLWTTRLLLKNGLAVVVLTYLWSVELEPGNCSVRASFFVCVEFVEANRPFAGLKPNILKAYLLQTTGDLNRSFVTASGGKSNSFRAIFNLTYLASPRNTPDSRFQVLVFNWSGYWNAKLFRKCSVSYFREVLTTEIDSLGFVEIDASTAYWWNKWWRNKSQKSLRQQPKVRQERPPSQGPPVMRMRLFRAKVASAKTLGV